MWESYSLKAYVKNFRESNRCFLVFIEPIILFLQQYLARDLDGRVYSSHIKCIYIFPLTEQRDFSLLCIKALSVQVSENEKASWAVFIGTQLLLLFYGVIHYIKHGERVDSS